MQKKYCFFIIAFLYGIANKPSYEDFLKAVFSYGLSTLSVMFWYRKALICRKRNDPASTSCTLAHVFVVK
jgi:hypothetical protein